MKIVAIIQARLSSSRLPGKVLLPIEGEPMLARVLKRVSQARLIDETIVATTGDAIDDAIEQFCQERGVACYRGSLYDVLDRFYQAAKLTEADVIIRITADCPMIDPAEIDRVIQAFLDNKADFAANRLPPPFERTTPIGMDTEVCSMAALERAWKEADQPYQREHVMPYLYESEGRFNVVLVDHQPDMGHLRFTVDTQQDLQLANEVYAAFGGRDDFSLQELIEENEKHPEWQQEVAEIKHKNLYDTDQRAQALADPGQKQTDNATRKELEQALCPLCGSSKTRLFEKTQSFGFPVDYFLCQDCGFVFQDARQSQAADPDFYQETYRKIYQANEEPTSKDLFQQNQRALNQSTWLKEHGYTHFGRILDIGASSGLLLDTFRKEFQAEVVGVEPGNAYRALAEQKNIAMFSSIEQLLESSPEGFNLVTLMHVLEHLENPIQVLLKIREQLLASDGNLLIEVPNFYAHDSYELAHLSCFSQHTLKEMLRQAGFKVVLFRKHGMPRSRTLDLYLTVLAKASDEPVNHIVQPEHHVAFKRKAGMFKRKLLTKLNPDQTWLPVEGKE